jgi:hypothetical protein
MEAFECSGRWWLPGAEEKSVAGTLNVSSSGGMKLFLLGALGPTRAFRLEKSHPIILGSVDKSPNGNEVTLTGTFLTAAKLGAFADAPETYHVARGYFGALLPEEPAFAFGSMRLRLGGLGEWIHTRSGFEVKASPFGKVGETIPLAFYTAHEPVSAEVPEGSISLDYGLSASFSAREYQFREEAWVKVTCETPTSADELNGRYAYAVRNLMSFVCDRAQTINRFSVYRPKAPRDEILVVGELIHPADAEAKDEVSWDEMLFTLSDVDFPNFIGNWLRLTRDYSAACNVYFGLMYGPPAFLDITFQNVANAVRLYHARHKDGAALRASDEQHMKSILAALPLSHRVWLVNRLGPSPYPPFQVALSSLLERHGVSMEPLIAGRRERFVNEATGTLEFVLRREPEAAPAASFGADLYWLTQKLRFLLKACFLDEAGFPAEKIRECFSRNRLYQHIYELELRRETTGGRGVRESQEVPEENTPARLKGSPEFEVFWKYLEKESARGRAVVIATYFDDALGQKLGSPEESLHSKIETAYRKDLLTRNERDDLQSIGHLRNMVVHRLGVHEFDSEEAEIINGLKTWRIVVDALPDYERLLPAPEDRLVYVAGAIAGRLKNRVSSASPLREPDPTDPTAWPSVLER